MGLLLSPAHLHGKNNSPQSVSYTGVWKSPNPEPEPETEPDPEPEPETEPEPKK